MSKPTTKRTASEGTTYRQRAAQARATAGQPQPASLPRETAAESRADAFRTDAAVSQDPGRGQPEESGRAGAAGGPAPRGEQDMGRHETFENAAPIAGDLLSGTALDRVYTLIEAHRSAYAVWDRASNVWADMVPGEPGFAAAQAASDGPGERERAAYRRLFSARPTTLAGAVALATYLGEAIRRTRIDPDTTDGERALNTITAALYGLALGGAFSGDAPATVAAPHPDEALFTLGADFLAAWVAEARTDDVAAETQTDEDSAAAEAAYRAVDAISERTTLAPAATVAGLGIKALLLARLSSEGSSPLDPEPPRGPAGSFWNVLRQVQEGASRLAGAARPTL